MPGTLEEPGAAWTFLWKLNMSSQDQTELRGQVCRGQVCRGQVCRGGREAWPPVSMEDIHSTGPGDRDRSE